MKYTIIQDNNFPPAPETIDTLFLDTETTSFDSKKKSIDVWKSCWVAGIAFSWDDEENIYFIPIRYRDKYSQEKNNSVEKTKEYIQSLFDLANCWVNHNVKYDVHVLTREGYHFDDMLLFDTLTQAKLINSDRFFYNEDSLAADWLHMENVDMYKQAMKPWIESSCDWGEVPIHIIAPYAAHDIYKERLLYKYICQNMAPEVYNVSHNECKVTKCLCRCEQIGLNVDPIELKQEELKCTIEMLQILDEIRKDHGLILRPNVNADCYDLFHKRFGLPVVSETEKGEPSYDKYALATLLQYPGAPKELIEKCLKYRELVSHNGFVKSYTDIQLDGRLHASYNQCIRTGRMSCSEPNMQQLNKAAKALIHPPNGYVFLSFDYSAIEFRLLAHYLGQEDILDAYRKDPDTDFHQWVADMCHVKRKPAKNINFCMAYGGGKKKVLSMLANNSDIIEELAKEMNDSGEISPESFESLCRNRAEAIYNKYHSVLHKLRPLTTMAANRLLARGFVKNGYGRLRHLPTKATYRALNTVIQSTAADCMKEAVVNSSPLYNERIKYYGIEQVAFVHDEILFICPNENAQNPDVVKEIVRSMLRGSTRFSVPLRVSAAIGRDNWANLEEIDKSMLYD